MSDRYVPMGYAAPPPTPRQGFIDPNAPQPYYALPATPLIPPPGVDPYGAYGAVQTLPYDPNGAPTRSWDIAPAAVAPQAAIPIDQMPAAQGWRRW